MKKFSLVACLIALAASLPADARAVSAQRQMNQARAQQGQREDQSERAQVQGNRPRRARRRALRNPQERRNMRQQIMRAIGLRPEQVARMNEIRRSFDDDVIASGRRIREARRALDRVIMSERFDQELFERQTEELAKAQADNVRLQARIRAQIRGVLTPEQVIRFNELERRMRRERREERSNDQ